MPGSWIKRLLVRMPKQMLLSARKLSTQSVENRKPYESIPLVTGGLPFVGSMARIGDLPGGINRAVDNIRKLRRQFDPDGKHGIIRLTGPSTNPKGDGRVVMIFHPDDVKAVFG